MQTDVLGAMHQKVSAGWLLISRTFASSEPMSCPCIRCTMMLQDRHVWIVSVIFTKCTPRLSRSSINRQLPLLTPQIDLVKAELAAAQALNKQLHEQLMDARQDEVRGPWHWANRLCGVMAAVRCSSLHVALCLCLASALQTIQESSKPAGMLLVPPSICVDAHALCPRTCGNNALIWHQDQH